jgi:hypothetical protein
MSFTVKPGKYLIEKSRRRIIGVIARVGTGGSVPAPVQAAVDAYRQSLAASGSDPKAERETIRRSMKKMHGTWLVLSPAGLRWSAKGKDLDEDKKAIKIALRNSGWSPPADQLDLLLFGPE